jgi:serine O-acetyltransferase
MGVGSSVTAEEGELMAVPTAVGGTTRAERESGDDAAMASLTGSSFLRGRFDDHRACAGCPSPEAVGRFFDELLGLLFPDHARRSYETLDTLEQHAGDLEATLTELLAHAPEGDRQAAVGVAAAFFEQLPGLFDRLQDDVTATFEGDPAAVGRDEVIRSYPGFYAIAAYRVAHALHRLEVARVPRMLTEHAHGRTGIDIHPGASIGSHFCIDHGTGVVIGETTEIGDRVKLYQGVTLGGLSVRKEDARTKRHPTIEDDVVIYAGATILGGSTRVGRGSVIGGNVWLTRSVPPFSRVSYQPHMQGFSDGGSDAVILQRSDA